MQYHSFAFDEAASGEDLMMVMEKVGKVGAGLSVACGIHCMLMPVLIAVLPLMGLGFFVHGWFEIGLMVSAIVLTLANLCWGVWQHRNVLPMLTLLSGMMWFYLGIGERHHWVYMMACGGCFLTATLLNRNLCRARTCCPNHTDAPLPPEAASNSAAT
jgi:MerC mercury resistance protein